MSNFNQYFRNQGAAVIVDKFFSNIDLWNPDHKLTELKWHIEDDPRPASYFIENGLTASHKVKMEYTINYDGEIRFSEFEVPREVDGAFIIEGAYRIATNILGNDYDCRINMSGTGRWYINFDYDRQYDIHKGILKIKRVSPGLGLSERVREYKLDEIDQVAGLEKEALRLTDRQSKKLQIKLDLDYKPEFICKKVIEDCIAYGDDRVRDLIIDKKIESVPSGFITFLLKGSNNRNYYGTKRKISNYWNKFNKLPEQVNILTLLCVRYWKGSSDASKGGSEVQVAPGINAINLESLTSKIQVPPSVAINSSMLDLIDVGDTPINQNVNKQNALTVSTTVTDDDVLFNCYTKDFQRCTISYLDYLNSKVVASESVDYEKNELVPDVNGTVEVKYRMKRKRVPVEEIDFIDLHPDYRLSTTTRRIPFLNYTDSVRVHMGGSMLKQSIPLVNSERPLVDTGNSDEFKDNILNEKFRGDSGVVKEITNNSVVIELPDGDTTEVPRRTAIQSVNDVSVYTEPKVVVGQKVKKGDIITGAVGLEPDTYKAGLNALVLFHAMFGYVNEDALVVSESFSKKMKSYSIIDLSIDVKSIEALKWIAPIGTKVKSKDPVVTLYRAVRLDEINKTLQEKLGGIFGEGYDFSEYTVENSLEVPNNIDEAWVSDVMVQENKNAKPPKGMKKPNLTFSHTSQSVISDYEGKKDRSIIYEQFPEYIASDTLDPVSLSDKDVKVAYTIRVRLIKRTNLMVGSKVTNRYGGKGVISKILPDDQMPIMIDNTTGKKRVVEVVMNPYSTINRKIPSVNMESLLGNIAQRIHDIVEERKGLKTKKASILPLVQKYYPGRFDGMTVDEFIDLHNKSKFEDLYYFNVGSYSTKFTPELIESWAKELGVSSQSRILIPTNTVSDLDELKSELGEEEYNEIVKGMAGKYTEIDKPLSVGLMHLIELYHIPTYSNKVTSSMFNSFGGDINEWRDSPIMSRGKYRVTGQKIGEMELSALLARGATEFISSARGETAQEDNQRFLNHLLGLGLTVTDSKGYNQGGSSLKNRLGDMKVKFRLKNQK